jgi:branched-subunit amino acid aminotransferase/4-amino-4-deoxychorismate lyase
VVWVDGRLERGSRPVVRADDSAWLEGRGCTTSVRIEEGRARFAERHARRLAIAARELRIGELAEETVLRALAELSRAAFGDAGRGMVRLQASRDADGALHLLGMARELGEEPGAWSAVVVRLPGTGRSLAGGLKVASRLTLALAADAARDAGADEALLVDAAGRLVEGARTNVVVADASGLATPPLELGAVAGLAREVLLERVPELAERVVAERDLRRAREVVAVNAVRGARAVVRLDGRPVGAGVPGPVASRLAEALAEG